MKHLFVTYEIALKLKELGFNEPCIAFFLENKEIYSLNNPTNNFSTVTNENKRHNISAPLIQQAVDFIREKLDIQINVTWNKFYEKTPYQHEYRPTWRNQLLRPYGFSGMSETYNEALNSAIEGALNYKELDSTTEEALKL